MGNILKCCLGNELYINHEFKDCVIEHDEI